jgi:hypothetical protein
MASDAGGLLRQKWPAITVAEAQAISAMKDPKLRNLKITQAYHDLKIALTRLFGDRNVTWCAYATWASKTAGSFIRGEEVPGLIRDYVEQATHVTSGLAGANEALGGVHADAKVDHSFVTRTIASVMDDVTKQVGEGNLLVFQELAPLYAAWLETFPGQLEHFDASAIDSFVTSTFTPGPVEQGGQDLLIQAFRTYYDAMFEKDPAQKAQQMFLANALVGYHEQIRLQGPIVGSLNAPLIDVFLDNAKALARGRLPHLLHGAVEAIVDRALRPLGERVESEWHKVSTRWMMKLTIPDVVLDLGKDVPGLTAEQMFPEELALATWDPLVAILAKLDRTPNTVHGSAASDWGTLGDRMNFVVDFFRSRQQDPSLYLQPFTDEQVEVILQGGMPAGAL